MSLSFTMNLLCKIYCMVGIIMWTLSSMATVWILVPALTSQLGQAVCLSHVTYFCRHYIALREAAE